jgi:hypothetical protein
MWACPTLEKYEVFLSFGSYIRKAFYVQYIHSIKQDVAYRALVCGCRS